MCKKQSVCGPLTGDIWWVTCSKESTFLYTKNAPSWFPVNMIAVFTKKRRNKVPVTWAPPGLPSCPSFLKWHNHALHMVVENQVPGWKQGGEQSLTTSCDHNKRQWWGESWLLGERSTSRAAGGSAGPRTAPTCLPCAASWERRLSSLVSPVKSPFTGSHGRCLTGSSNWCLD